MLGHGFRTKHAASVTENNNTCSDARGNAPTNHAHAKHQHTTHNTILQHWRQHTADQPTKTQNQRTRTQQHNNNNNRHNNNYHTITTTNPNTNTRTAAQPRPKQPQQHQPVACSTPNESQRNKPTRQQPSGLAASTPSHSR